VTEEQFDGLLGVHLKGPFFLTQALLPLMADGGAIVNLTSATTRVATAGVAPYAAFKGGLEVLTRYMAKEFGDRGIRANSVAPGAIRTDLGGGLNDEFAALLAGQTALGRVGEPDDVGRVIASLLSEDSGWINAQSIEVGRRLHHLIGHEAHARPRLHHPSATLSDRSPSTNGRGKPLGIVNRVDYDGADGPPGHPDLKGFGCDGRIFFWLREGVVEGRAAHVGFVARQPAHGRRRLCRRDRRWRRPTMGRQAVRAYYDPRYYAAGVLDPDGYSLEFVSQEWQL
jgi:hypothetical protein